MHHDHDDHHAGAPVMKPANQASPGQLRDNVPQAVVGVAGRGRVVEGQQDTGKSLQHEEEHGDAAEHLMPTAGRRDVLVKEFLDRGLEASAVIEPLGDTRQEFPLLLKARFHPADSLDSCTSPSSSLFFSTLESNRSSGRGAGPEITLPSIENTEV